MIFLASAVLAVPLLAAKPVAGPWALTKAEDVELERLLLDLPAPPEATGPGAVGDWIYRAQMGWPKGAILRAPVTFSNGPISYRVPAGAPLGQAVMVGTHVLVDGDPPIFCTHSQWRKAPHDVAAVSGDLAKASFYYADWFRVCFVDSDFDMQFDKAFISVSRKKSQRVISAISPAPFDKATNVAIPGDNAILISQKPDLDKAEKVPRIRITAKANYKYFIPDFVTFNCRGSRTQYTLKSAKSLRKGERFAFGHILVSYDQDDASGKPVFKRTGTLDGCRFTFQSRPEMVFVFY